MLCVVFASFQAFIFYSNGKIADEAIYHLIVNCFLLSLLFVWIGYFLFIFSIVSLIRKFNISGLVISIIGILVLLSVHGIAVNIFDSARGCSARFACRNLRRISMRMRDYSHQKGGEIPAVETWCDALVAYDPNSLYSLNPSLTDPPDDFSCYGLNKNLIGEDIESLPSNVVLLFETKPAQNPLGGKELLYTENNNGKGCVILFGDF